MSHLKVEMRLLNTRHVVSGTRGVGDLIFSEPTFTVEHEWGLLDSLQPCFLCNLAAVIQCIWMQGEKCSPFYPSAQQAVCVHGWFSSQSFWKAGSARNGSQTGSSLRTAGVTGVW